MPLNLFKLRALFYVFVFSMIAFMLCSVFSMRFLVGRYDTMISETGPKIGLIRAMRSSFSRVFLEGVSGGLSLVIGADHPFFKQELNELNEAQNDFSSLVQAYKNLSPTAVELEGISHLEALEKQAYETIIQSVSKKRIFGHAELVKMNGQMDEIERSFDATATLLEKKGRDEMYAGLNGAKSVHNIILWLGAIAGICLIALIFVIRDKARAILQNLQQSQSELQLARDQAISAAAAKSAFLANMSHEIRTPMNGVIGLTNMLADSNLTAEQSENVTLLQKSGEALLSIINDVLDFSKIESGHLRLEKRSFHLRTCAKEAVDMVELAAREKHIALHFEMDKNLPAYVVGDQTRLRQILVNLLSNAVKFTPTGRVTLTIRTRKNRQNAEEILFTVTDTGIGLKPDQKKRLFSPFTQADDSTTRRYGGSGLGLSICKNLCEAMGGRIGVRSRFGSGSVFYFTARLPSVELAPHTEPAPGIFKFDGDLARKFPLQILMAEDNSVNQRILQALLAKMGYQVDTVDNGRSALEAVVQKNYDLIFMDVHMPDLDGWETTRLIPGILRPSARMPWVVAMTASVTSEDMKKCLQAGMRSFLGKPIHAEELQKVIAEAGTDILSEKSVA